MGLVQRSSCVRLLSLALAIVAALIAANAWADGGGRAESAVGGGGKVWTTMPNGVVGIDPVTGEMRSKIVTGSFGRVIGADRATVWVVVGPRRLVGIDPRGRRVRIRVQLRHGTYAGATGSGAVWLPSVAADTLSKIDARTGAHRWDARVPHSPMAVTVARGSVWVASIGRWHAGRGGVIVPDGPGIVSRLDPVSGQVRARIRVGKGPQAAATGDGALWVLNGRGIGASDTLDRLDMQTNQVVASIRVPHWSSAVACGRRYCWVVSEPRSAGGVVTRVDPRTNRAVICPIPRSWTPAGVVALHGRVWVADPGVAQLIRIDARTLRVMKRVKIPRG
jgi:streptogramin lyase